MKRFDLRDQRLQSYLAWTALVVAMLAYLVWMSYETVLRYDTFKATAFDLGNMDQAIWNTLHGRLFQFTNQGADWYGPPTRLGFHVEPILLPVSLLYLFHADPRILLVFQTLVLALGALPVFLLTRRTIPEWPLLAPVMVVAYLLAPALLGLNLFDFHPLALATPLLLYAVLALEQKRYSWFLVACILASACKEEVPLVVACLGILVIWKYKLPRLGLVLILGGSLWSLIAFKVVMPHFDPGAQSNNFWYRYEDLGSSPGVAIVNLLLHPWLIFTLLLTLNRLYYLASLFRSTGFLALLAPEWLIPAIPNLAVNLFSFDALLNSGVYHYNASIIPFVIIAAIHGIRRLLDTWYQWRDEEEKIQARVGQTEMAGQKRTPVFAFARPALHALPALPSLSLRTPPLLSHMATTLTTLSSGVVLVQKQRWQRFSVRMIPLATTISVARLQQIVCIWILAMTVLNLIIMMPLLNIFWADHLPGDREKHTQQLLAMIPADASVSASSNLNPHLTERLYVTVFPELTYLPNGRNQQDKQTVQYVIVDLNAFFPEDRVRATDELNQMRRSGQFRDLAQAEGVILLQRIGP